MRTLCRPPPIRLRRPARTPNAWPRAPQGRAPMPAAGARRRVRIFGLALVAAACCALPALAAAPAAVPAASPAPAPAPPATPPATAAPAVWGRLVAPDGKTVTPLSGEELFVGSDPSCAVRLVHGTVEPRHARLTHKDGIVMIEGLPTRYGTLVAGAELKKGKSMQLFQTTLLSFGAVDRRFEWANLGPVIQPIRKQGEVGTGKSRAQSRIGKDRGKSRRRPGRASGGGGGKR